ncbi:hypothetical protein EVAR_103467_1 [Eumeta japonica]|uniref:Uncharacterized protein n=1 Tax=Eumeta variegata TaxID=151549 RepID=A0A4C1YZX1_EUMVA|nr:hypothetical protein EVAR_103467_1 [Eumeta japonica]
MTYYETDPSGLALTRQGRIDNEKTPAYEAKNKSSVSYLQLIMTVANDSRTNKVTSQRPLQVRNRNHILWHADYTIGGLTSETLLLKKFVVGYASAVR